MRRRQDGGATFPPGYRVSGPIVLVPEKPAFRLVVPRLDEHYKDRTEKKLGAGQVTTSTKLETKELRLHRLTGTAGQLLYILGERLRTEFESLNHGQIREQVIADFLNGQTCS